MLVTGEMWSINVKVGDVIYGRPLSMFRKGLASEMSYQVRSKFEEGGIEGFDVNDGLDDDAVQEHFCLARNLTKNITI